MPSSSNNDITGMDILYAIFVKDTCTFWQMFYGMGTVSIFIRRSNFLEPFLFLLSCVVVGVIMRTIYDFRKDPTDDE